MNRLTKAQKDKVKRFASVADADEATAMAILKEARWDLEVGLETYFTSPMGAVATGADAEALEELYQKYRADDDDEEMIGAAGIERFCDDIGIDPMDPVILVVALKMNAQQMGKFTKEEFLTGMRRMGAATTDKLKEKLPLLRAELEDPRSFKDVYEYSFDFSKEPNQKSLPLDTAAAMWGVLLGGRWALVEEWCDFLRREHGKAVTRDTWSQTLEFSRLIGPDLEGYDPAGAWPYLIDEFVEERLEAKAAAESRGD